MIHEIAPHVLDNQYKPRTPRGTDRMMLFTENKITGFTRDGLLTYPVYDEVREHLTGEITYLFSIDDTDYYLGKTALPPTHSTLLTPMQLRGLQPPQEVMAGMTALHLMRWYESVRYCGRCGHRTLHHTTLRAMTCPACKNLMFPKISPAIIVAVTDGERLLLTKYAGRATGFYALVAGFVEIGETAEECVRRELMEEVGVRVKNIRYYASQPWGFDGNLMLGFTAQLDGKPDITLQTEELSCAVWLRPEEIGELPETTSLTREMIRRFRDGELFPEE